MNIVALLQIIKKLLAHLAPETVVDVIVDVGAFAFRGDQIRIAQERKMVADGRLMHLQGLADFCHAARPFLGKQQHDAQLAFFTDQPQNFDSALDILFREKLIELSSVFLCFHKNGRLEMPGSIACGASGVTSPHDD